MNTLISHSHFNLYLTAIALAIAILVLLIGLCVMCRMAWLYSRFERVCGGYRQAMNVLNEAESQFGTDSWFKRGMKYAQKRGWI